MSEAHDHVRTRFKPRTSLAGIISNSVLLALLAWLTYLAWSPRNVTMFARLTISLFALAALFFFIIYFTIGYELSERELRLRCGPFVWRIPYKTISEISRANLSYHPTSTGWKLPGFAIFKIYYADRGDVTMCATSVCRDITLVHTSNGVFGVTPREQERFVETLKERLS